jgi:uncharacterized membrane protein YphA (DoxX/SURF4 family)
MPKPGLVRAFVAMWWTAGILLFVWSARTVQMAGHAGHHDPHVALLGLVEAASAALFLYGRTMRIGAAGLLLTFAVALGVHAARGEFRPELLLYAAVVAFIAVHGAVPMSWLRPRHG